MQMIIIVFGISNYFILELKLNNAKNYFNINNISKEISKHLLIKNSINLY